MEMTFTKRKVGCVIKTHFFISFVVCFLIGKYIEEENKNRKFSIIYLPLDKLLPCGQWSLLAKCCRREKRAIIWFFDRAAVQPHGRIN